MDIKYDILDNYMDCIGDAHKIVFCIPVQVRKNYTGASKIGFTIYSDILLVGVAALVIPTNPIHLGDRLAKLGKVVALQ